LGESRSDSAGESHERHRIEADDFSYFVWILVHKAPGRGGARVVDQKTDAMIIAEPNLHLGEVSRVGEIGSQDIDLAIGFPAKMARERFHPEVVTGH
jgi:hypothetical protein